MPKYPNCTICETYFEQNALTVITAACRAMREHGVPETELTQYRGEATSGSYEDLKIITREWITISKRQSNADKRKGQTCRTFN